MINENKEAFEVATVAMVPAVALCLLITGHRDACILGLIFGFAAMIGTFVRDVIEDSVS